MSVRSKRYLLGVMGGINSKKCSASLNSFAAKKNFREKLHMDEA